MFLSFFRVVKFSIQDIARNVWLSLVTVIVLILALFTVNMLLVVKVIGETAVTAIKEKIDINLYLKSDADESDIILLKSKVADFSEVRSVEYISKEQAKAEFLSKHENNPELIQALTEVGQNPLTPILMIKPASLDSFDNLTNRLNGLESDIIESRNFSNYKEMLNKINAITDRVSDAGLLLASIFVFIAILVIYNSVRVAIYTHRKEIAIMRLVGASNWFIRTPYLLSSIFYTIIGLATIMAVFYPFLRLLQPYLETFFVGYDVDIVKYFYGNVLTVFGPQFVGAALINLLASYIAVRKYSRV